MIDGRFFATERPSPNEAPQQADITKAAGGRAVVGKVHEFRPVIALLAALQTVVA